VTFLDFQGMLEILSAIVFRDCGWWLLTSVSGFIAGDNFHNGNIRHPIQLLPQVIEQSRKDSTFATLGRIKSAKPLSLTQCSRKSAKSLQNQQNHR